ncbi:MAG: HNH endonuclease [Selenomonadaceae bacterium]|nr:HNH endonuclease [Selenomonadaceae bacterium]
MNTSCRKVLQKNSQWRKNFSDAECDEWTDKLGNLALITKHKNSSLSNLDYADKKQRYFKQNVERFPNLNHVLNTYNDWTPVELKQNHAEVVRKLLETYR